MFIGIDLGTSGLKALLLDRNGVVRAQKVASLTLSHPHPLWSEQDPAAWWTACESALAQLLDEAAGLGISPASIEAIGLTGQMHGATLLDASDSVLRPAILWNDGRAFAECAELERRVPELRRITGNLAMPGFTAPKLLWLARHEPDVFARVASVLLPKDYLRLRLTGVKASDMSDSAGTLWLDVAARDWSDTLLAACGLSRDMMPALFEGNQVTGHLTAEMAHRFGLPRVPVVAGGGDNAAGAVGVGVVAPGQAMLSLGTSGVSFVATDRYRSNPERAVHSFCHALPNTWHLMSVMLSAASCLDFTAKLSGQADVATLLAAAEARGISDTTPTFLPYLTGERTPHNNPAAQACFFGLTGAHDSADMANAALEGIGLGLKDGFDALDAAGASPDNITLIGGGSRSAYWAQMLADIIGRTLVRRAGGDVGPALGAARLAHLALAPETPLAEICRVPDVIAQYHPDPARQAFFQERRRPRFLDLYQRLAPLFPKP